MQLGLAGRGRGGPRPAAGLDVVMDRCVKIEHARFFGGLNWAGSTPASSGRGGGASGVSADDGRTFGFDTLACTPGSGPTRSPARARCRSTRRRRSSSTTPTTRRAVQPADVRQRLLADLEPDRGRARGARRGARGRARGARRGARAWPRRSIALLTLLRSRRPHRRRAHALRRHVHAARRHVPAASASTPRSSTRRPGELPAGAHARTRGCSTPRRSATRSINILDIEAVADVAHDGRRPAGHRQHVRLAVPVPADRARRRHRRPLGDQVHRRPRHDDGRRDRRVGQVPLGQRQVPGARPSPRRLPRRALPRDLRRLRRSR